MPHRVKNRHKPRHHTHKVKPANLVSSGLPPLTSAKPAMATADPETNALEHVADNSDATPEPVIPA